MEKLIKAFQKEIILYQELKLELDSLYEQTRLSDKRHLVHEDKWLDLLDKIKSTSSNLSVNIDYIDKQITSLQKVLAALTEEDPSKLKQGVVEYVETDVSFSLKNLAMGRFDYQQTINSLRDLGKNQT